MEPSCCSDFSLSTCSLYHNATFKFIFKELQLLGKISLEILNEIVILCNAIMQIMLLHSVHLRHTFLFAIRFDFLTILTR